MTQDPRRYFPSEGSHTQDFYALKIPSTPAGFEPANLGSSSEYDNHRTTGVDKGTEVTNTNTCKIPLYCETKVSNILALGVLI